MKRLNAKEQKKIIGGGPCGLKTCSDIVPNGAVYTGACASSAGCSSAYIITTCTNGIVLHTYCSTGPIDS